mmetsp:Transcript_36035/g.70908  ORF Transcript_36035/g.70908 Transcript_36035/m.70908 type:complete len:197 (+) Transcript_36035:1969-2559(+)
MCLHASSSLTRFLFRFSLLPLPSLTALLSFFHSSSLRSFFPHWEHYFVSVSASLLAFRDQQMEAAKHRFPYNTPPTKEAYFYRTIFHSHFPGPSAERTVPGGPSIACSTAAALAWDAAWSKNADASGRALCGVHVSEKQFSDAEKAEKHVKAQLQKASGGKGEGGDEGDPHRVSPSLKKRRVTIEGDEPAPVNNGK